MLAGYIVGAILMNLFKAFHCISYDLIIVKLAAYGLDDTTLELSNSYLKDWKQCVRVNNKYTNFEDIISGVTQGSIIGPILFSLSVNNLFFFIEFSTIHKS